MIDFIATIIALLICCLVVALPLAGLGFLVYFFTKKGNVKHLASKVITRAKIIVPKSQDIIEISQDTRPFQYWGHDEDQWKDVLSRAGFTPEQHNWVKKLSVPYKRYLLEIKQCEDETIRLYADLAMTVDKYLHSQGSSLDKLVAHLNRYGGYYSNILYTLECIAEGEVERHYKGGHGYDNDFSYQLLTEHTNQRLTEYVRNYLEGRAKDIPLPNQDTISRLGLTPNGLPRLWWDPKGTIREKSIIDPADYRLLQLLSFRRTRFLDIEQCRLETIKLFIRTIRGLQKKVDSEKDLSKRAQNFIRQINAGVPHGNDFYVVHDIYKLCENTLRQVYPGGKGLNIDNELKEVKKAFGAAAAEIFFQELENQKSRITPPSEETLAELLGQNPSSWKSEVKTIKDKVDASNYLEYFELAKGIVRKYQSTDAIGPVYWELFRVFVPYNKIISLYFYSKCTQAAKDIKAIPSSICKLLFAKKREEDQFNQLLNEKLPDEELLQAIKEIFVPKRRTVEINSTMVEEITAKHQEAVQKLSTYMNLEAEITTELISKSPVAASLSDVFTSGTGSEASVRFNDTQVQLLKLFVDRGYSLNYDEIKSFAQENKLFINTLISGINQVFYDGYEDQLILGSEAGYQIDQNYISILNKYI